MVDPGGVYNGDELRVKAERAAASAARDASSSARIAIMSCR